jgi:hypothetical protein
MPRLFANHQWAVTRSGIDSVDPEQFYAIPANELATTTLRGGEPFYEWPLHMAEKPWVDIEAFIDAFEHALDIHRGSYAAKIDRGVLGRSLSKAREQSANRDPESYFASVIEQLSSQPAAGPAALTGPIASQSRL